jgi:hypothetical protein
MVTKAYSVVPRNISFNNVNINSSGVSVTPHYESSNNHS